MRIYCFKIFFVILFFLAFTEIVNAQGKNHNFFIGYDTGLFDGHVTSTKATLQIDSNSLTVIPGNFKMPFRACQANISDENGNLLMLSNGCWIADASGDTMLNGGGLSPGSFTDSWCDQTSGNPYTHSSVFLPWPGDTSKYVLFHQTGNDNVNFMSTEFYYSIVDMNLNGALGGVVQKNIIAIQDTLNPGFSACKHANGRDWWIIIFKDKSDVAYKLLLTPNGILSISTQHLGMPPHNGLNGQPQFSPDGSKFAYQYYYGSTPNFSHEIRLFDFDRCTGMLSNGNLMNVIDSTPGFGLCFSPNSRYLYFCSIKKVFQFDTTAPNVMSTLTMVANNDGYCYPYNFTCTDFWLMYLAANGKIYISSGNGVIDMHFIDSPDSGGVSCSVQQHAIRTPCYFSRGNVLHPNYYLGPVTGSICDSLLHVGLEEHLNQIQDFKISPNPSKDGFIKITYLLPQNADGIFEVFDINGKIVFTQKLSAWSSLQYFNLSFLHDGVYECIIRSAENIAIQKLLIIKN